MKAYANFVVKEFNLCLGYRGQASKVYSRNYRWETTDVMLQLGAKPKIEHRTRHAEGDWTVTMVDTGQTRMTGGRLGRVIPDLEDDSFRLTFGDRFRGGDSYASSRFHPKQGKLHTVNSVQPTGRPGADRTLKVFGGKCSAGTEKLL